ncbi:g1590 [Coccomyxa elongata]
MSPKVARQGTPDEEDKSGLERKSSLRLRSNSLRGSLRKHKTHEAPGSTEEEIFTREWKITPAQEEQLMQQFKEELKRSGVYNPNTDYYFLRRFLRARQHDLKRAKEMYAASMKWRAEFGVDTILEDFQFHERDAFISLYPQGYHKTDKTGRPIYIQHLGAIHYKKLEAVTTEERMIKFHVQEYERCARVIMPACSIVAGRHIDQTFAIIDVKGVGLKHLTGDIKKMLSRIMAIDQNNYPEMLGHTCIINAPSVFKMVWQAVKSFIDPKTQEKIEICKTDYVPALLKWVDAENLPEYLGGTSKATLLDDAGPWQDPKILAQVEANNERARLAAKNFTEGEECNGASPNLDRGAKDSDRFADLHPIMTRRSVRSDISDSDDAFYSPKSNASFSDGSFTSTQEMVGRSPSGDLDFSGEAASASALQMRPGIAEARLSVPVLERVRELEEQVPGLEAKLCKHLGRERPRPVSGGGTLVARVEVLEEAVDALLQAQEAQLKEQAEKAKSKCLPCCCIM